MRVHPSVKQEMLISILYSFMPSAATAGAAVGEKLLIKKDANI
jgi:hypothetical protein